MTGAMDVATDAGLRHTLRVVLESGTWDVPAGQQLLGAIRAKAVRHASRIGAVTRQRCDRDLVDDVVCAAWAVLDKYGQHVLGGDRPWAYLMSAASRRVLGEIRAMQHLTGRTASEQANAGGYAPRVVVRVGASMTEVATALGHERAGEPDGLDRRRRVWRAHGRDLADRAAAPSGEHTHRDWYAAFVGLLAAHGADEEITVAAVDHLSNLFTHTRRKAWETTARRDPVLARLGLSADQCGALVALLAGSRRERACGQADSLLVAVRHAERAGMPVELSVAQSRRLAVYLGRPAARMDDTPTWGDVPALAVA